MKRSTTRWIAGGKALLGIAVLFWLVRAVDLERVGAAVRDCRAAPLVAGLAVLIVSTGFQIARLHTLVRDSVPSLFESIRITLGGHLFNQLLPGGLGGEGYRTLRLKAISRRWSTAIGLVTLERGTGFLALLLPGALAAWLDREALHRALADRTLPSVLPGGLGGGLTLVLTGAAALALMILVYRFGARIRVRSRSAAVEIRAAFERISIRRYLAVVVLSLGYHVLQVEGIRWLLVSLGAAAGFFEVTAVLAFTMLVSMVPVSLGSLGVKEGAIVFGLGLYGVGAATGLAVALFNRLVLLGLALTGGLLLLSTAAHRPEPPPESIGSEAGSTRSSPATRSDLDGC